MLTLSKPKLLVYWNVRRVDHHFSDAVWALNKLYDVTFIGNNKYKNSVDFDVVNPLDYDLLIAYDSGSQTFNLDNNKYDLRLNDIKGIPKVLRVIDSHLRTREHIEIAKNFDLILCSSKSHLNYFDQPTKWLPMHTNTEFYSIDKATVYNYKTIQSVIGSEYYPSNFEFAQSTDRYIDISFLIKFRDFRSDRAKLIFNSLPKAISNTLIVKAFKYAATYFHSRSKFSLHLKCGKFDNYMTWRPLDAMSCGAIPIIQSGEDDVWKEVLDSIGYDGAHYFNDDIDLIDNLKDIILEYKPAYNMIDAVKKLDIYLEPKRLVGLATNTLNDWTEI